MPALRKVTKQDEKQVDLNNYFVKKCLKRTDNLASDEAAVNDISENPLEIQDVPRVR
jgi:hypothetical protein